MYLLHFNKWTTGKWTGTSVTEVVTAMLLTTMRAYDNQSMQVSTIKIKMVKTPTLLGNEHLHQWSRSYFHLIAFVRGYEMGMKLMCAVMNSMVLTSGEVTGLSQDRVSKQDTVAGKHKKQVVMTS